MRSARTKATASLGARILLNEAREFIPGSEKWITWADVSRLHDRISGREAKTH